jgi:curved DNA-binding protein CbpA
MLLLFAPFLLPPTTWPSMSLAAAATSPIVCFYVFLGVERDADVRQIHKAYLKMALKLHPDKNPDALDEAKLKFQQLQRIYGVLKDSERRAIYDKYGEAGLNDDDDDDDDDGQGAEEVQDDAQEWGITIEQARALAAELLGTNASGLGMSEEGMMMTTAGQALPYAPVCRSLICLLQRWQRLLLKSRARNTRPMRRNNGRQQS